MTLENVLNRAITTIQEGSSPHTARLDAEVLLAHTLCKDRSWLHAHLEHEPTASQLKTYLKYIKRRARSEPVAYITSHKEFYGRDFIINNHVLVPRPESEAIIDELRELLKLERLHRIIDIGTGSGCLAITAKLEFPYTYITATDTSKNALKVAAKNALHLKAAITFKEQSILTNDKAGYDIALANLPYVPVSVQDTSIKHEPAEALYSGDDGLDHYRNLFEQLATKHIFYLITESLTLQHEALTKLAVASSYSLIKKNGLVQVFKKATSINSLT